MCAFRMQHESMILNSTTVEEEFNVTANDTEADIQRLCRIVTYYYFVEAIDNDSNIYYYLKQNAMDALAYWVSFTSYTLLYFGPSFDTKKLNKGRLLIQAIAILYDFCGTLLAVSVWTSFCINT